LTKLLAHSLEADEIDALLRELRVTSTVWCRSALSAPWGFAVRAHGLAAFHVVTAGACWLEVDGDLEQARLRAGDLVILPRGDVHRLRDEPDSPTPWLEDLLARHPVDSELRLEAGGGGATTELLCGAFTLEGTRQHPLLSALPTLVRSSGEGERPLPWLAAVLDLVAIEAGSGGPGGAVLLERLSEVMITQALRTTLLDLRETGDAELEALHDRGISPAVRAIHDHPEHAWTLGELAHISAMSRSAFASRFRKLTGDSPMRYVTRCRLARAARELGTTDAAVAGIALRAGYESEFAFSRAFKRTFGVPPGVYRHQDHGTRAVEDLALRKQDV
jgi:AraC-like DNA-binding protein